MSVFKWLYFHQSCEVSSCCRHTGCTQVCPGATELVPLVLHTCHWIETNCWTAWRNKEDVEAQSHIPSLFLDYKTWSPNSSSPTTSPSSCVCFLTPPFCFRGEERPDRNVPFLHHRAARFVEWREAVSGLQFLASCLPCWFSINEMAWGGGEVSTGGGGGSEEESSILKPSWSELWYSATEAEVMCSWQEENKRQELEL